MKQDKRTPEQMRGDHGECATLRVKADNEMGFAVINAHDFDSDVHVVYDAAEVPEGGGEETAKKRKK